MRNTKRLICAIMALVLGSIGTCAVAQQSNSIGYAVRAILPNNQLNDSVLYFDLKMEPGQQQTLQVIVMNREDEEIEVAVEANTAFSNSNGVIEFTQTEDRDPSMVVDFAQIAFPVRPVVTVPANGEAVAEFLLRMPDQAFEGVVYGGFMFTKLHQMHDGDNAGGMSIRNIYRYVIGARLRVSEAVVEPEFELLGAETDQTIMPALVAHLRNPAPVIARDMALHMSVYPHDSDEAVITFERNNIAMAPNSTMPYTNYLGDTVLENGAYRVSVKLEFEDRYWHFETPLTVDWGQ